MNYRLLYTHQAVQDLEKLEKATAKRIVQKLKFFGEQSNPLFFAKKLQSTVVSMYRFRIGPYRVLFDVAQQPTETVFYILRVKHRRDVYRFGL